MTRPEVRGDAWRAALDGYLGAPTAAPETEFAELAIQVELRELVSRSTHRWNGPTSTAVRRLPEGLGRQHRLGIRPAIRTTKGWSRSGLAWATLHHQQHRRSLDPAQLAWCAELVGLHRAVEPPGPGRDPDWIFLDTFTSPILWTLLDRAAALGLPLVGSGSVEIGRSDGLEVGLDLRRTSGGLHLGPRLTVDGIEVEPTRLRPIGDHGAYRIDPTAGRIDLIRADGAMGVAVAAALSGRAPTVDVPASGEQEFLDDYLPELRDHWQIGSADRSVELPTPQPPLLVIGLDHSGDHTLSVTWRWAFRGGGSPPSLDAVLPLALLPEVGRPAFDATIPPPFVLTGEETAVFMAEVVPELRELAGLRVEMTGKPPAYRELTGAPHIAVTAVPSEKNDWFDLGVTVTVEGRVLPFEPLFRALARRRRRLLLVDGTYLSLQHPSLQALADLIEEAAQHDEWEPTPSLSRYQTELWAEFVDLADVAEPALQWKALLAEAAADQVEPTPVPVGLRAELRPYQREGLSWLAFLWRHRLGGILADDMGLGKTLQCLALVQHLVESGQGGPVLVVAPTSVVPNWIDEASRFTPDLVVRAITATQAASGVALQQTVRGADIVVTSYALLRLDETAHQQVATEIGWAGMILDEAQAVKNPAAKTHEVVRDLPMPVTIALTGTPLENSLTDLHALLTLTAPGLYPLRHRFITEFVRPIEVPRTGIATGPGAGNAPADNAEHRAKRLGQLRRRIKPFLLRRTKSQVATELPAKQEQIIRVTLGPDHRELYDLYLQKERRKVLRLLADDEKRNKFIVFRSLTLLRLLALDASLISADHHHVASAKLDALLDRLEEMAAEGHRALVFSQFTSYLSRVAARLDRAGIEYVTLDGSTRNRGKVVDSFRNGTAPVFLISLKAGGFGLNLTEADHVFLLDPWWNPAAERQAIDRTHRIGQDRPVFVHRLVAADTVEEKVLALQQRKADLFDAVVGTGTELAGGLTGDDLKELLG